MGTGVRVVRPARLRRDVRLAHIADVSDRRLAASRSLLCASGTARAGDVALVRGAHVHDTVSAAFDRYVRLTHMAAMHPEAA